MSLALMRAKVDAESRQSEEKKAIEKKRNIIVLCQRYFQDLGYIDSVRQMQNDTNISLDRLDAADNVDLQSILTEYEDFHEMRFGRKPKITRKVASESNSKELERKVSLPRLPPEDPSRAGPASDEGGASNKRRSEKTRRSKSQDDTSRCRERPRDKPPPMPGNSETPSSAPADAGTGSSALDGLVVGQSVTKASSNPDGGKKDKDKGEEAGDDFYDNQLMRALPNYGGDKEFRELAITISRDIITRNPGITWDSIVGLSHAKALLKEAVVMPLKYPHLFTGILTPWKGVLLFGSPGTGKTLLAKAVATECETTFFNISASSVVSKWRGDSEKLVRVLFDLARHHQPSTIFIDELDSLMGARGGEGGEHEGSRRMKTELLIQMDGLLRDTQDQVFMLAASNLPWDLDSAMLRRLEKRVYVALPNPEAREGMFRANLPEGFAENLDYAKLASSTEEWSGSDIRLLCKEAAMHPLRRLMAQLESADAASLQPKESKTNRRRAAEKAVERANSQAGNNVQKEDLKMDPVRQPDVMRALETVHRAPAAHLEKYSEWQEQFGAS